MEHTTTEPQLGEEIAALFRGYSIRKLEEMTTHLAACLDRLTDQQIWLRGADHENTIGNLILHLCGNMMQWILHGVAGEPDIRQREQEFSAGGGLTGPELVQLFRDTVDNAIAVIAEVPAARLPERITPQGRDVAVLEAIYQVVGHVQQHVGQIILLTKQMTGQDLDLTIRRPRASPSRIAQRFAHLKMD